MTGPEVVQRLQEHLKAQGKVYPCHTNRASELGHPCDRYLVYNRVAWEHKQPPDPTLAVIFRDGVLHEQDVIRLMQDSGLSFQDQQKSFTWPEYEISGHIDGTLADDGELIPTEIKSVSPYTFQRIHSQNDLFDPKRPWVQKWGAQVQIYLLMMNVDHGLLVLKCKAPAGYWPIKVIDVDLDYEHAEVLLQRAERVNAAVKAWNGATEAEREATLPARVEPTEEVCGRCPFLHICLQARSWGPELIVLDDSEIVALAERRKELEEASAEFKAVDDRLKAALKNRAGAGKEARIVVGEWVAEVQVIAPKDKKPYQKVNIEKVGESADAA